MKDFTSNLFDSCLAVSFLPATAVLEITGACNHQCIFCSCPWEAVSFNGYESKEELSVNEWKTVIDMLCERGVNNIAFSGGEALLRKGIFEIIEYASSQIVTYIETKNGRLIHEKKPPKLYLISNGTAITRNILAFLQSHNVQLSISLPGLSTLKEHTGVGNPDVILNKFRIAHEMGIHTVVNVTVTKKNLFELYHILSAAFLSGANQLLLNRFLPGGRGISYEKELMLNVREVQQMLDVAEEALSDAGRFGDVGTELPKCIFNKEKYKRLSIGTRCSAALGFFVISPDGFIRVCNHSTVKLEHFTRIDMLPDNLYWKKFTMKDYLPSSCFHCSQIGDCDGGCREAANIHNGSVDSLDPLLM